MTGFDFTPEQENKLIEDLRSDEQTRLSYQSKMSPQLSQQVGSLYRNHPYAPPGLLLSTANAVQNGMMDTNTANQFILKASQNQLKQAVQQPKEEKKSWWDRNVASKVRTASRWTMAGLNFVPQAVTNIASQAFDGEPSTEGFFISTDLGTLIKNDEVAGDGWFVGGRALELQAERARRYRGEIDGHAWTLGRGFASVFTQPGSREYNILSGLVDASAAIAIPSVPGVGQARGVAAVAGSKVGLRTLAGLTDFESAIIQTDKVASWLQTAGGRSVVRRIKDIDTIDEALDVFKDVQHMDFINKVVELKDETQISNYLLETLGRPIVDGQGNVGKGVASIDQINLSRLDDVKRSMAGRSSFVSRMMSAVPGQHVVLAGGNPRDVANSVRNVNNYLKTLRVDDAVRDGLVKDLSTALVDNNGRIYDVISQFDKIFEESLKAADVPTEAITALRASMKEFVENKNVYGAIEGVGEGTAHGSRIILQDGTVAVAPSSTAGLESEMLNQLALVLPDPRRVRRMMSQVGWIYGKGEKLSDPSKYRNLRLPFSALEGFQNEIWRPITLMTGGYVMRNLTDSAFRYSSTPGLKGGLFHPLQWIQIASGKKFRGTLGGVVWDDLTDDAAERIAREGADEFDLVRGQSIRENFNPTAVEKKHYRDRNWDIAGRASGAKYRKGIQDEVSLLHDDMVARMVAEGYDTEEIIDLLKNSELGKQYIQKLQGRWANREMQVADGTGAKTVGTPDLIRNGKYSDVIDQNLTYYVDEYIRRRIESVTGNNSVLRDAIATGEIVDVDGNTFSIFDLSASGKRNGYARQWDEAVQRVIKEDADLIASGQRGFLKETYKFGGEIKVFDPNIPGRELPNWIQSWNKTTDKFFSSLYPKRSAYLMQSPVFRQYYYKEVGKFIDELDQASLMFIGNQLRKVASDAGETFDINWLKRYIGESRFDLAADRMSERLLAKIENPTRGGKLSLAELDAYAKGSALDQTKNLFYNAAEKSNFADILRIAVPFGSAWAEVIGRWSKIAVSNPQATRRIGVSVQGLRNADPDGDGKGFFWKDPTTGEYVFNYPFSEQLGGLASALIPIGATAGGVAFGLPGILGGAAVGAGVGFATQQATGLENVRMIAPVKSLNMGLNIWPGAGPFVQIAANKILTRIPQADSIRDAILPYGEPDISTIGPIPVPSWARKVIDGIVADPDSSRLLGDMTIDVMRVLQASGKYDLSSDAERDRLENDAITRARTLLIFRGFGQLVGPTRPDIDFEVATKEGDKYTTELSKAFHDMQAENFDTAVERFISTFGEDAFLYTQGKTEAVAGGLDASTKFGRFERDNSTLFGRYTDVAGYFAPVGSNFDYAVYTRQIETGQRRKLTPTEFMELAQQNVGRALYKASQRAVGPNPSKYQKDSLRAVKQILNQRFPGYAKIVIDINAQEARINEVIRAAQDPILDDNPVAIATRTYLQYRSQALNELAARGIVSGDLTVQAGADIRAYLRNVADVLVQNYPEFERMYDRVFYNEVEGM